MSKDDEFWGVIGELATKLDPPLKVRTTAEADAKRKAPGRFHFMHRWVNVEAHPMGLAEYDYRGRVGPTTDVTRVLQRCRCNKVQTIRLMGHWTLEEINRGVG